MYFLLGNLLLLLGSVAYLRLHGRDKRLKPFLLALTLTTPYNFAAMFALEGVERVRPYKLDLYVYRLDQYLGFQPSFVLGRLVQGHSFLNVPLEMVYQLLPIAMVLVFGGYLWRRSDREAMSLIPVFVLDVALSIPFYLLVPVCGPVYAFPGFPSLPNGPVVPHPILLNGPPNGVPSIHFSTALLILWYSRKLPLGRWIGGAFLFLTAAATMGLGEHYFFDLVASLPYAVMVYKTGNYAALYAPRVSRYSALAGRRIVELTRPGARRAA
ncbi:membrane hypothetical protein [Candidatus Sulfopaludibacter sp. SbA4]|nr:membrane hypothetical protein [Candidatus Sulfopaludibacter sp. SbA4]